MTTVESQPFRPTAPTSNKCGRNCGYAIFNNNGTGFEAGTTKCVAKVSLATGDVPNSDYSMMWRLSGTKFDCFKSESDGVHKSFASTKTKRYVFTAYFKKGKCPAKDEVVTISVDWV